jgi:hypothetical protein
VGAAGTTSPEGGCDGAKGATFFGASSDHKGCVTKAKLEKARSENFIMEFNDRDLR